MKFNRKCTNPIDSKNTSGKKTCFFINYECLSVAKVKYVAAEWIYDSNGCAIHHLKN